MFKAEFVTLVSLNVPSGLNTFNLANLFDFSWQLSALVFTKSTYNYYVGSHVLVIHVLVFHFVLFFSCPTSPQCVNERPGRGEQFALYPLSTISPHTFPDVSLKRRRRRRSRRRRKRRRRRRGRRRRIRASFAIRKNT